MVQLQDRVRRTFHYVREGPGDSFLKHREWDQRTYFRGKTDKIVYSAVEVRVENVITSYSIHYTKLYDGQLVARGETDAPVCTTCHGEHGIIAPEDPRSPVSPIHVAEQTCAPCHESARLNVLAAMIRNRIVTVTWRDSEMTDHSP